MDFPGGSITNIRVLDGFSNIYWRIYTEEQSSATEVPNNGPAILKHISRFKELELRLRSQGCLVLSYPRRLGLLIFSATPEFEHLAPLSPNEGRDEHHRLLVDTILLKVWASGCVTSSDIVKGLSPEPAAAATASAGGPQRMQNGAAPPRRLDNLGGAAAIYASFISAVTGAFSLHLIRHNNAIPLGPRTLFTLVESDLHDNPNLARGSPFISALTTLQVQLTSVGKLTVTLQTISQTGLTRISQPGDEVTDYHDLAPGTDLWLSPSGSIARLVSTNPEEKFSSSPRAESNWNDKVGLKRWKANVLEWLSNFGLATSSVHEESWVEVEVWEPFYAKLSGEASRTSNETPAVPLKRIIWPAIYCFRRTKSSFSGFESTLEEAFPMTCDPLEFAESWRSTDIPKSTDTNPKSSSDSRQTNHQGTPSSGITILPDGIESLSRASLYPELQAAGVVYPTPPDGATGIGQNPAPPPDVFAEDSDYSSSLLQGQMKQKFDGSLSIKGRSGSDVPIGFGPSAGLVVGSGLYDTNEDDDLFGDMNERDFGSKGITDADFSFFDDPGFSHMDHGADTHDMLETPEFADSSKPEIIDQPEIDMPAPQESPITQRPSSQPRLEAQATEPLLPQPTPENNTAQPSSPHDRIQTISPPLSPVEVKRILFSESKGNSLASQRGKVPSYYSPISFKPNLSAWDQKYGTDGKFWFTVTGTSMPKDHCISSGDIPTIGLPRPGGRAKMLGSSSKILDSHTSPASNAGHAVSSSGDTSSEMDDDSDESSLEDDMVPAVLPSRKRKRARSDTGSLPSVSHENPITVSDQEVSIPNRPEDSVFLGNFLSTFSDWTISGFFSLSENLIFPALTPRELHVQVAQILIDQVTQSSLDHKLDGDFGISCLENQPYALLGLLEDTDFLGGIEKLDMNSFVSLQDNNSASSPAPSGPSVRQPAQRREAGKGWISKIPPPHLRVRRGKDFLETLPAAVSFWETFGLEPAHGAKDISAYCIHPSVATRAADAFLERLGLLYTGCNLGSHKRGDSSDVFDRGLGPWDISSPEQNTYHSTMQRLRTICEELGSALLNSTPNKDNIVVYIINPFPHAAALVDICSAFWCLLQKYVCDTEKQQNRQLNELVLQIIPAHFVTSAESLVVPPQAEYLSLAFEVYSRCYPSKQSETGVMNSTPPVLLAEPLPSYISFKLASERSSPLQEGKCLHVACSRSQDQRWVSVAWSDNTGALQRTVSYCLRYRNSVNTRSVFNVRNEIWSATKQIMDKNKARWRVIIVSTENVDQEEHDTWITLAEQYNKTRAVPIELAIFSVNPTPDLFLSPPVSPIPMSVLNPSSTPAATPNPSTILSPDQLGNAPTPPGGGNGLVNPSTPTDWLLELETESVLTDICDETWGVVLSHRLNSTLHLTEYRPALVSGYLLRRKGSTDSEGAFTMNVNLLYTQRPSSSYESLLREVLGMYRDLATLARARGTRMVQTGTLPWHIATAVRAQEILSYVL